MPSEANTSSPLTGQSRGASKAMNWPRLASVKGDYRGRQANQSLIGRIIEGRHELGVTVADQKPATPPALLEGDGKVAGLLAGPSSVGMGGDAGQEDLTVLQLDKEQD